MYVAGCFLKLDRAGLEGCSAQGRERSKVEAIHLSKQEINAGQHAVELATLSITTGIIVRHHVWLHTTALSLEIHVKIEDLPFEGATLFSAMTDKFLATNKKNKQNAKY
uniref:Uncharacterized protein n=1 Tax=Sphaerodactylus townsendi TaxID=933632 RepID=A0ACB8G914_9SAUR